MFKRTILLCWIIVSFLAAGHVYSQTSIGSPYSRYGIGDMFLANNTQTLSLGGAGLAWGNSGLINYLNPASYAAFDTLAFVFEGGMGAKFGQMKTTTLSQRSVTSALTHMLFGFSVNRRLKASFGLLPYSRMGYNIGQKVIDDTVGSIVNLYTGTGGINQVYLGGAYKITEDFSVGLNAAYLFGTLSKTTALTFPDSAAMYNYRVNRSTRISDFLFTLGLQYQRKLSSAFTLGTGLTYSNGASINAWESMLAETYSVGSTGTVIIRDTVDQYPETSGILKFPSSLGFGLILKHKDNWLILMDYKYQNWKNFSYLGIKDSLKNSFQASLGFQITPDFRPTSSYMEKITYRAGFRYTQTYLQLRDNRLTEMGFSLGLALPLPRSKSHINLAMEVGKRGTTNDGLLQENYVKLSISATVLERWFMRRKFE